MYSPMTFPEPPSMKKAVLCRTGSLSSAAGGCASRYFAHSSWAGVIFFGGPRENGEDVGKGADCAEAGKDPWTIVPDMAMSCSRARSCRAVVRCLLAKVRY